MRVRTSKNPYWSNILIASMTLYKGLKYTARHIFKAHKSRKPVGLTDKSYFKQVGLSTLQYPHESFPIPDNGRYRLHNEMDDCIVCDKCAKVCPVDCIDIEPIRAVEEIGKTSDGTPKRIHAARFDIDMSKCCFCGLCTTVCPTECLTMTKAYEFSEFDVKDHNYAFSILSETEAEQKKQELGIYLEEKQVKSSDSVASVVEKEDAMQATGKPVFKPKMKPLVPSSAKPKPKPVFKPKMKPIVKRKEEEVEGNDTIKPTSPKPVFKPKMKPVIKKKEESSGQKDETKPVKQLKPVFKKPENKQSEVNPKSQPKPIIRPKKDSDE